jgi:putative ABC transport system permease protein
MSDLFADLRFGLRTLRRAPAFAAAAVLTIAIGIGATTAIFSAIHGVILRPLPYPDADRLVTVWENWERRGGPAREWTGRSTFADWREHSRAFAGMAAVSGWSPELTGVDRPDVLAGAVVSPGYFAVLGVQPVLGRGFTAEEEQPGRNAVAVLSHELWLRRFGGDPAVLGRSITLNARPTIVVGVLPPGFRGPIVSGAEIWAPLVIDRTRQDYGNYFLRVIARLAPDATLAAARDDVSRVAAGIAEAQPLDYRDVGMTIEPLHTTVTGSVRQPLWVLFGAVVLILAIACVNVANLQLVRASARQDELAVRAALGAGRGRLVTQLLTESVLLALVGGGVGVVMGIWGSEALLRLAPSGLPRVDEIGMRPAVLLFSLAATVVTGLLFGLAPAFGLSRRQGLVVREGGRGSSGSRGWRLRDGLVVAEVGLGMAVLLAAGLLLRSLDELRRVDPGFRVHDVASARVILPTARYPEASDIVRLVTGLEERVRGLPGVRSVGAIDVLPLSGLVHDVSFGIESSMPQPGNEPAADERRVTPGFFDAMGVPLLRGRGFTDADRADAPPVTIVSESFARRYFPDGDPLGQRLRIGGVRDDASPWWTIVGVAGSVRSRALDRQPEPEIYLPFAQRASRGMSLVVRTAGEPAAVMPLLRDVVGSLDPDLPVSQVATARELARASLASQRFLGSLLGAFAGLALLLAGVGLNGVIAFTVRQRVREIGIRLALGARPGDVLGAVLGRGLRLTAVGLAIGAGGALAAGRTLRGLLYDVSPTDPGTFAAVGVVLTATALFACYWPARRAARLDPVEALRHE